MLWRDVASLIPITKVKNIYGEQVATDGTLREVFVNVKSVGSREFYQASAVGIKPEIIVEMHVADYDDETKLKYNDKTYQVIRTYSRNGEYIELTCSRYPL